MPPRVLDRDEVARWEVDLASESMQWWLAVTNALVVGFVGTGLSRDPVDPRLGEIDTIAVAPVAWRHGVGRALMGVALDDPVGAGYREGIVWTLADYPRARAFYEAMGWRASGEVRLGETQVAFRHPLQALDR